MHAIFVECAYSAFKFKFCNYKIVVNIQNNFKEQIHIFRLFFYKFHFHFHELCGQLFIMTLTKKKFNRQRLNSPKTGLLAVVTVNKTCFGFNKNKLA